MARGDGAELRDTCVGRLESAQGNESKVLARRLVREPTWCPTLAYYQ